jgi:hypothetical protein
MKIVFAIGIMFLLSGCAGQMPASVAGGECRVFTDPGFAVQGKRVVDKRWIGATQEKGIEICNWKRPVAMPKAAAVVAIRAPTVVPTPIVVLPPQPTPSVTIPKKHHWYDRFRRKPTE